MHLAVASAPVLLLYALVSCTTAAPAVNPISISPSQSWDGNDGEWSSFAVRVGTPAQTLRVLVSTTATSTWVVADGFGCDYLKLLNNCADERGMLFKQNSSRTWKPIGPYDVHVEENLGISVSGDWGFDTDYTGTQGPTLLNTTVTQINDPDFLLGTFGLNPRPNNFTTENEPDEAPSYLSLLHEQNLIPSLSYSYTAGAKYRHNGVLGSLILGGYDEGLFTSNDLSFPFFHDQERDLTVGLQAIRSEDGNTPTDLLPQGILTLIDSTVSQIWLPIEACEAFENAFGIKYDSKTGYYLLNGRQHSILLDRKPTITFTLGQLARGGETVDIVIPYHAFDLNISYPLVANNTYYFPLRRAANESQYTLGRTFLQEAYLTVDYERHNFSVSKRNWELGSKSKIVAIGKPDAPTTGVGGSNDGNSTAPINKNKDEKSGISTGAIAGIAIAGVALLIAIGLAIFFCRRRKQKLKTSELEGSGLPRDPAELKPEDGLSSMGSPMTSPGTPGYRSELGVSVWKPPELHGHSTRDVTGALKPMEMYTQPSYIELDGQQERQAYELEAPHGAHEVSAVEDDRPHGFDEVRRTRQHSNDSRLRTGVSPLARRPVGG